MTSSPEFTGTIEFNDCAICKKCCRSIDEGVCAYNTLSELLSGRISAQMVKKFCIFRIKKKYLDILAADWVLYPWINILPLFTKEVDGAYEFLILPKMEEGCPFLTEHGCLYPDLKLFDCRIFPFFYEKGKFYTMEQCAYAERLDQKEMKVSLKKTTEEFIQFCKTNQEKYFQELPRLKELYGLETYDIPESNTPLCSANYLCREIDALEAKKKKK